MRTRGVRNVPTWQMTNEELAREFARARGFEGRAGGWIYRQSDGKAIAHGWTAFADWLLQINWIIPGKGINWMRSARRADANGRL
jgi:hypothetical protein